MIQIAKKQIIKISEAKILIYLSQVDNDKKFASYIANKLIIDYGYLLRLLHGMEFKGWIKKHVSDTKVFYSITGAAPIDLAKNVFYMNQSKSLEENIEQTEEQKELN